MIAVCQVATGMNAVIAVPVIKYDLFPLLYDVIVAVRWTHASSYDARDGEIEMMSLASITYRVSVV